MITDRPTRPTARRALGVAALVASFALVGACGSPATAPTSSATATATPAAAPSTTDTPRATPSTPDDDTSSGWSGATTVTRSATQTLPMDAADYGEALITAWQADDDARLAALASPAAAATLNAAKAPADLIATTCEANLCSWTTEDGARLTLTYDLKKVAAGAPQAVTAAKVAKD